MIRVAVEIRKHSPDSSSTQTELVSKLATTAITKFDFFRYVPHACQRFGTLINASDVYGIPDIESFKKFLDMCRDLECTDALNLILEKAGLTTGLSPRAAYRRARSVMFPLLDHIIHGGLHSFPQKSVEGLAETAVALTLSQVPNDRMSTDLLKSIVDTHKAVGGGIGSIRRR